MKGNQIQRKIINNFYRVYEFLKFHNFKFKMDEQLSYTKNSFNSDLPESDHYKNFDYKDEAIQLIQFSQDDHSFRANPEAIQFLNSIEPPIAVVAVAGMYRTGKSYLLNRILLNR